MRKRRLTRSAVALMAAGLAVGAALLPLPSQAQGDAAFGIGREQSQVRAVAEAAARRDYATAASQASSSPLLRAWVEWKSLRDSQLGSLAAYDSFFKNHPGWPDRARLEIAAERLIGPNDDPQARLRWFEAHPPRTRDGRERLAEAYTALGRADDAANVLAALDRPSATSDWRRRQRASREALDKGDFSRAYSLAAGHGGYDHIEIAEGEWLAGWIALRYLHDPATALGHFQRLSANVTSPISVARGAYWSGRAAAAMGRQADARIFFARAAANPTTFYGQMAAAELNEAPRITGAPEAPVPAGERRQFERQETAALARLFCNSGLDQEAAPFIRGLGAEYAGASPRIELVYDLARRCARPDLIVVVGKLAAQKGADPIASYPIPDIASVLSPAPGMPSPATILGIARQESQFDSRVVSPAGAMGLIQLMPGTARGVAGSLGIPFQPAALTEEPEYNVQLGSEYLARQLDRFGGAGPLAFAAYNAGPARVDQWIARYGDPRGQDRNTMIDWIESIPFNETRNYVQRVSEAQTVYETLLRQGGGRLVPLAGARRPVPGPAAPSAAPPVQPLVESDDDQS